MEKQQNGRIALVCPICGKTFKVWRSEVSRGRKYCSLQCYWKVQPNRKLDQNGLEETLRALYFKKKLTTIQIGKRLGCDPKTVTYWMDKFNLPRRSFSEIMKMNNPAKRPDVKEKMRLAAKARWEKPKERKRQSEIAKKLWENPDYRKRVTEGISRSLIGNKRRKGIPHSKEVKKRMGEASKRLWKNPEYARKVITALQEKPNLSEAKLIRLIKENGFPFRYVGDGQVVIDGQVPDFMATDGSRKVIELFGVPWHDPNHSKKIKVKYNRTEKAKHKFYESHGYDCLILWDDELSDEATVVEKINSFIKAS